MGHLPMKTQMRLNSNILNTNSQLVGHTYPLISKSIWNYVGLIPSRVRRQSNIPIDATAIKFKYLVYLNKVLPKHFPKHNCQCLGKINGIIKITHYFSWTLTTTKVVQNHPIFHGSSTHENSNEIKSKSLKQKFSISGPHLPVNF